MISFVSKKLQETKIEHWNSKKAGNVWAGRWVDYIALEADGTKGGIIFLWDKRTWSTSLLLISLNFSL